MKWSPSQVPFDLAKNEKVCLVVTHLKDIAPRGYQTHKKKAHVALLSRSVAGPWTMSDGSKEIKNRRT